MPFDFIDHALQILVDQDILPRIPSWELLKDHFVQECMMHPDALEARRDEIVEKWVRVKREELEKVYHNLLGMTPNGINATSTEKVSIEQVVPELAQPPEQINNIKSEGEKQETEPIDDVKIEEKLPTEVAQSESIQSEGACFINFCLPDGTLGGGAFRYCNEEDSYINPRMIERHKLEKRRSTNRRAEIVKLTWLISGKKETHMTRFIVCKDLPCDFMLGTKRLEEDFNRDDSSEDGEDAESASSSSKSSESLRPPLPQMYSLPQAIPDLNEYAKLVGVANAQSIKALMQEREMSTETPRREQRPGEDVRSTPSVGAGSRRQR